MTRSTYINRYTHFVIKKFFLLFVIKKFFLCYQENFFAPPHDISEQMTRSTYINRYTHMMLRDILALLCMDNISHTCGCIWRILVMYMENVYGEY